MIRALSNNVDGDARPPLLCDKEKEKPSSGDTKDQNNVVASSKLTAYPFPHCLANPKPRLCPLIAFVYIT